MTHFKNIVITGASSGIGKALAIDYAAPGIALALNGRDGPRLQAVAETCRNRGATVDTGQIDVVDREALAAWLTRFDDAYPVDLLIANAGISIDIENAALGDLSIAHRTMAVNVGGVFNTVGPLVDRLAARGRGQIAFMSSLAGFIGLPHSASYNASKAAVRVWGESLRYALKKCDVGVSMICPGFVESRITARWPFPMPFLMSSHHASAIIRGGLGRQCPDQRHTGLLCRRRRRRCLVSWHPPPAGVSTSTGWAAGGQIGYDFVGPRIELQGGYGQIPTSANIPGTAINGKVGQMTVMANLLYDFMPTSVITPYVGVGAGVAFIDSNASLGSTQFAYKAMLGVAYNVHANLRLMLEGRYLGTTNPSVNTPIGNVSFQSQNIMALAGIQFKFGAPDVAPPPPAPPMVAPPSFMVFFDWDRSNLSAQALNTIKQAAAAYKTKGNARITATGHTDTSGPEAYNMALSLRRANTVKDALVREGVPATAIAVIGRGEAGLLVKTADGVREPQNRRVEIVIP